MNIRAMARGAYELYSKAYMGLRADGTRIPTWDELPEASKHACEGIVRAAHLWTKPKSHD